MTYVEQGRKVDHQDSLSQIILFHFLGGSNITFIYNLKLTHQVEWEAYFNI